MMGRELWPSRRTTAPASETAAIGTVEVFLTVTVTSYVAGPPKLVRAPASNPGDAAWALIVTSSAPCWPGVSTTGAVGWPINVIGAMAISSNVRFDTRITQGQGAGGAATGI